MFTINVNDLDEVNTFSDTQKLNTLSSIINQTAQGAKENRFFDGDEADNLIEITPADAQQQGGLRARNGNDKIIGTQSNDTANGNAGNDTMIGAGGDDFLQGGQGSDLIDCISCAFFEGLFLGDRTLNLPYPNSATP